MGGKIGMPMIQGRWNGWRWLLCVSCLALCQAYGAMPDLPRRSSIHQYHLKAEAWWQLTPPNHEDIQASGLNRTPSGELVTVSDRGATLYRIELPAHGHDAHLSVLPDCFTPGQLSFLAREKWGRYDVEGIAVDSQGRLLICEEANRWILRWDPKTHCVERLAIDWSPVQKYFSKDRNASFEGIAIGGDRLYVANEREMGRIIVVDLATLKIVDHFVARPVNSEARDVHYSDLCWFDGHLYALMRESGVVLKIEPRSHRVLAEYDYKDVEYAPEVIYQRLYPTSVMEGLYVDRHYIWLVTDSNGYGRVKYPEDKRPTLFKCRRTGP